MVCRLASPCGRGLSAESVFKLHLSFLVLVYKVAYQFAKRNATQALFLTIITIIIIIMIIIIIR